MTMPVRAGLLLIGDTSAMMVRAPFMTPDPPSPWTVRPMMSIVDEAARAQIRDPASKTETNPMKSHFGLNSEYSLPVSGCSAELWDWYTSSASLPRGGRSCGSGICYLASMYADPYHPTSRRELKLVVISGIAWKIKSVKWT